MDSKIDQNKLNKLLELNKRLASENDFSKKMRLISETIKDILKVDRCSVFLHDDNSKSLWSVYIDGISYIEIPDDTGIASEVYKTGKTIIINDTENSPLFNSSIDKGSGYSTKAILSMPIFGFGNRILGVIQLINKIDGTKKFTKEDEEVLKYVMNHISAYLEIMVRGK